MPPDASVQYALLVMIDWDVHRRPDSKWKVFKIAFFPLAEQNQNSIQNKIARNYFLEKMKHDMGKCDLPAFNDHKFIRISELNSACSQPEYFFFITWLRFVCFF